jgi:hypothetical protein
LILLHCWGKRHSREDRHLRRNYKRKELVNIFYSPGLQRLSQLFYL